MKVKLAVALAALLLASAARADSNTAIWNVIATPADSSSAQLCSNGLPCPPISFTAQMTTEIEPVVYNGGPIGTASEEPIVVALSGLFDGEYPMTLVQAPEGEGFMDGGIPDGIVYFSAEGVTWSVYYDFENFIVSSSLESNYVNWTATDPAAGVPEPTTYAMLMMGLVGLLARRRLLSN
jgi:hypothetical protein